VLVLGHVAHMLARSYRQARTEPPKGGPWGELNARLGQMADKLAHRTVIEAVAETDAAAMLATAYHAWPREFGREAKFDPRLERRIALAEILVEELVTELEQLPLTIAMDPACSTQWGSDIVTRTVAGNPERQPEGGAP